MAQFDVHRNPSRTTRERTPFLLEVQSDALAEFPRRVVVPLANASVFRSPDPALNPDLAVDGQRYVMIPTDIASVPIDKLGTTIVNLRHDGDRIVRAIDFLIARY